MGNRVFVSYKHSDDSIKQFEEITHRATIVRDYVDILQARFKEGENFWHGEHADESLDEKTDEYIRNHLKDKIFPTSVTIVLISPKMKSWKDPNKQWIPWEIRYSLTEINRSDRTSSTNGIALIVLPDRNGLYSYFVELLPCNAYQMKPEASFRIIDANFNNRKNVTPDKCEYGTCTGHFGWENSFFTWDTWSNVVENDQLDELINRAVKQRDDEDKFDICKEI